MTDLTPARIERAGLEAWPGIEVEWDGNWVRRAAGGYTKRANSLQCFDPDDGADAEARLAAGVAWFRARGIAPVVRTTPLASPGLNTALDAQGWDTIDRSHLYAMELGAHEPDAEGRVTALLDPEFLAAQQALQGHTDELMSRMRALLAVMAVPATGIVVYRDGAPAASGLMAIADGIVVTGNVITDRSRRRQGLGAAMMRTGLAWAKAQGATLAALNVQADNTAAMALYSGLGYRHQYDYTYRIPGRP
jgi:ribosomal protein S18 acetylase RimI-like enzyme